MSAIIPNWPAPNNVKAFCSTRHGGFSLPPYDGLNVGMHVGDDPSIVAKNRDWLQQYCRMPSTPIWLNQTHSTRVIEVSQPSYKVLDADGIVTSTPRVVCSAMTADCLPILITNMQGTRVAAVHAGWRGLAGGIVEQALDKFSDDVLIWLGPAIGPQAFEVGDEVRQVFCDYDSHAQRAFSTTSNCGKWLADIAQLAQLRLAKIGIDQVVKSDLCTYQHDQQFYSYRRDGVTGRQACFIWIE
ncbi:peptidoglycan editing factor PgeF [Vibrio metschnikovii]|uniref:peptidoglycan editing factor PgeF n=1 Tax=Vibrio metschnikovii TaxID=28172 RepID=UPI00165E5C91|nr:peptidoglycan editing factor PgeF [Vibrio metschnikovii]EKO3578180.1 peptidoglycan editing factor PgeF [Vibrio metschnikovii]EKO3586749.1 peptidoglycan editing factor PgeF [Vibrio metschnikovii]EKO3677026.1 peptidoglycan editing factor PgeF [Vibrio metschnikovii]EKO3928574.1 peptidoglycan editing factor PgeF [Vibrio metschnikovii]ELF5344397.1 peptidoglycan editing factor PgeF [Vibrio metschnikovii]